MAKEQEWIDGSARKGKKEKPMKGDTNVSKEDATADEDTENRGRWGIILGRLW